MDCDILYGVFSSDSYDGSQKKPRKDVSNYSNPLKFVSTEDDNKGGLMDEDDVKAAGLGLGFGYASWKKSDEEDCFGEFEKHTKGIGMRLLEKMGYKGGAGLGINQQGIVAPIEAKLRPKNMGIGFNHCYKDPAIQEESDEKPPSKEKLLWSKKVSKKKKVYKTAEQLLLAKKQERGFEVVQKVFDMRGPQVRVLTDLKTLNAEEKDVPMPELERNMKFLIDLDHIQKLKLNLRNGRKTVAALLKEKERLQKEAHDQKQQLENMEVIVNLLDQIGEKMLNLESLAKSFADLQTRFADEYTLYNLSSIAFSYAMPLFIRLFQGWDPLENPTHGIEEISLWKTLDSSKNFSTTASSPYTQLLMEVVFPAVRTSVTNSWQARDPEPMLRFWYSWEKLVAPFVRHTILDTLVLPKISSAVDSWDPRSETVPIHTWIHPWLPLLGHKLESCCHAIRDRLGSVLHAWHPSDMSAYHILSPWKTVFDRLSWEQLMVRHIIPKLFTVMHEFQLNPADQNLDRFYWVRTWLNCIPTDHMLDLMDVFFNKWQLVLYHWLGSKPKFKEVVEWYLGWKGLLPEEVMANEHVRFRLVLGLDMMEKAAESKEISISYLRQFETRKKAAAAQVRQQEKGGNEMMRLKEVVEFHAQENGLVFKPKPGRMHDGLQIYGFGNMSIVIDSLNQKVFAQTEERWSLVSLEQLLELQNRSKMKRC